MADATVPPLTEALDVIVELLSELDRDAEPSGGAFYDRLCSALCRVANMERAGLLLYDDARKLVIPVGSHGIEQGLLDNVYGTLEETPIAQLALAEDRVVEIEGELVRWVPERYAGFQGVSSLTCTPVAAAGRWLGVIFADRGGAPFKVTEDERNSMWALGRTAALAASVRIATGQQGRARLLQARIDLARDIHDRVVQRLFGVSLVLGSDQPLSEEARRRCADEMQKALVDLREAITRPLAPTARDTGATLREELARLGRHYQDLPLELEWEPGVTVPRSAEPLAQSVLAEALRNARKHARPSIVEVRVGRVDDTFVLEVRNDGLDDAPHAARGTGMGLRLAAAEALQLGGVIEFGAEGDSRWRVRLVVPMDVPVP
jgi:signal transduction histidine kinase